MWGPRNAEKMNEKWVKKLPKNGLTKWVKKSIENEVQKLIDKEVKNR